MTAIDVDDSENVIDITKSNLIKENDGNGSYVINMYKRSRMKEGNAL